MNMPIEIGGRRELFVDNFLIDSMQNARLQLSHPERREVALEGDAPWEDWTFFGDSLIEENGRVRLYYRAAITNLKKEDHTTVMALAESTDGGRSFTRPRLGLCEFKGSTNNNIVWNGGVPGVPPAFLDTNPACPPDARYKGLSAEWKKVYAMASADGIRWRTLHPEPLEMPGTFDTINTAFWDKLAGCYRSYTRYFNPTHKPHPMGLGVRCIQMSTSRDFIHWTPPVPLQYEDQDEIMELYTNAIVPCPGAEHLYLGFPNRIVEERNKLPDQPYTGINDALFMASRDGVRWTRYRDAWVRPGLDQRNWTQRNNYPTWQIIQTSPEEWSILISEHYMQKDKAPGRLRRLSIRPWGFASVHAGFDGGELRTKPFVFSGRSLCLNYATSAAGSLQAEMQDENGKPIPGFSLNDMPPLFGDEVDATAAWNQGCDLSQFAGKPVRLRFVLKDADLFALRFA